VSEGSSGRGGILATLPQHRRLHFASLVLLDAHNWLLTIYDGHSTNSCRLSREARASLDLLFEFIVDRAHAIRQECGR